ncbi:DUF1353 domain-containing protein [Halomonas sp. McH1-25]|uniref:DUF1353 domain-containing protein n=1 Tax=unclassified Halomonas TaxID=2609666 RepID=UPI001EF3DC53|nr:MULTISPECIES: DUF1353 domain-containing protein [unclassified Halomonas]MCG7598865.1 DUF1353 domain-containing protein [Halomonas sp. McH1-25]MCP1340828.1 DUF1353 domain-containing protein [Halomonas sp. FL8]MCP1361289.1 DUF1353 domain-containing protein [Halomonas sp. BBD45]MCP1363684.1 DUF1353 domain-containing protein [Halomonas sp. BBD48]
MRVTINSDLVTVRAPKGAKTPWLTGRATRWMIASPYVLTINGTVRIVPKGYIFDGSSIPSWLWWLFPPSYGPAWRAAAYHDYCYSHLYRQVTKQHADEAFHSIMLADGAKPWIAKTFHWAVSSFGKGGW